MFVCFSIGLSIYGDVRICLIGHARELLNVVYSQACKDNLVFEVTVEDPAPEFCAVDALMSLMSFIVITIILSLCAEYLIAFQKKNS